MVAPPTEAWVVIVGLFLAAAIVFWMIVRNRANRARQAGVVALLAPQLGGRAATEVDALASLRTPRLELRRGDVLIRLQWGWGGWAFSQRVALTWVDAHPPLDARSVPAWPQFYAYARSVYRRRSPRLRHMHADIPIDGGPFDAAFRVNSDDPARTLLAIPLATRDALLALGPVTFGATTQMPLVRGGVPIPLITLRMPGHLHDQALLERAVRAVEASVAALEAR